MYVWLEKKFLPFVEKPARYIGCEPGTINKDPRGKVNIALSYPDLYEVGMSYHGLQILYHLINKRSDALCERVFAPAPDAEDILRQEKIDYFALESKRPLREFDLIGFTLSYELVYTNLLNILNLAGLELLAANRSDDHPLIVCGGPICFNPEPMAAFVDFFFIGEVEEALDDLITAIKETRCQPRRDRLMRLAQIEGIYVPEFYDSQNHRPLFDNVPEEINPRHTVVLKSEYYPDQPLVPLLETAHDRVSVEIMRGCPQNCHFCQAGKIYKPVRLRSQKEIKNQIMANLAATGYDEVSLLSLSSTDYPKIGELARTLSDQLAERKVALAFPSLRPASFTVEVADAVQKTRRTGLTFAPEVGTERLRRFIKKKITDRELLEAVTAAFDRGWPTVKLYFMIGLPTETDEDLDGIVDLVMQVVRAGRNSQGQKKINITISPFSAKAHTPFQWDRICSPEEIKRKQQYLDSRIRAREVTLKFRNPQVSYLEGILGRGDRTMSRVILEAYNQGARLDGWGEHFDIEIWHRAFETIGMKMDDYSGEISFSQILPWDIITRRPGKDHLKKERTRASEIAFADEEQIVTDPAVAAEDNNNNDQLFGRRKRRVIGNRNNANPTRGKIRLKWGKRGPARFMSHLDNNRAFERAIRRSEIPVVYSQGFHPHQKLSFGPPLPLGYSSDCEYLDIQVDGVVESNQIKRIGECLPLGFSVLEDKTIFSKAPAISTLLNRARYEVRGDFGNIDEIKSRLTDLLTRQSVMAVRGIRDGGKQVDIRQAIFELDLDSDDLGPFLTMELGLGEAGYAKPSEVLKALGGLSEKDITSLHFHRRALLYKNTAGVYLDPLAAVG